MSIEILIFAGIIWCISFCLLYKCAVPLFYCLMSGVITIYVMNYLVSDPQWPYMIAWMNNLLSQCEKFLREHISQD